MKKMIALFCIKTFDGLIATVPSSLLNNVILIPPFGLYYADLVFKAMVFRTSEANSLSTSLCCTLKIFGLLYSW